jgi:hypothetical protein
VIDSQVGDLLTRTLGWRASRLGQGPPVAADLRMPVLGGVDRKRNAAQGELVEIRLLDQPSVGRTSSWATAPHAGHSTSASVSGVRIQSGGGGRATGRPAGSRQQTTV